MPCDVCSAVANWLLHPGADLQHLRHEEDPALQPLREHGPHPDEAGILGIILGVVESRVSQLRYFAMRQIHDWLADHHGGLL
jgi:hypothetical protein